MRHDQMTEGRVPAGIIYDFAPRVSRYGVPRQLAQGRAPRRRCGEAIVAGGILLHLNLGDLYTFGNVASSATALEHEDPNEESSNSPNSNDPRNYRIKDKDNDYKDNIIIDPS